MQTLRVPVVLNPNSLRLDEREDLFIFKNSLTVGIKLQQVDILALQMEAPKFKSCLMSDT